MGTPGPPVETIPAVPIPQVEALPPVSPPAPQPLPADLDQPLSAFDPAAIPDIPLAPPPPLAPLVRAPVKPLLAEGERFETFELTPPVRPPVPPKPAVQAESLAAPETDASVHALLDRLERGIARRVNHAPQAEPVQAEPVPQPEPAPPVESAAQAPKDAPEPAPPASGLEGALAALRKMAVRV